MFMKVMSPARGEKIRIVINARKSLSKDMDIKLLKTILSIHNAQLAMRSLTALACKKKLRFTISDLQFLNRKSKIS